MHAVFQPTRIGSVAVEIHPLLRVENVIDGEELVLGPDGGANQQDYSN
jgi:hypothetical protein